MPEEYKIDYTGIQVPDIESVKKTAQQFTDWRRSMGFQTEEEKNAALKAEMQAAQQRFNDQNLWNSEDPYEVYNTYETDPAKQAEFQRNGQMVAGIGSTIATLPFTAGMMGWIPALTTTTTGVAGGYAGAYGGQKLGQYLDNKYGWNTTPWLSTIGGIGGGILGGGFGYRGTVKFGSKGWLPKGGQTMYGKQFITDVASDALSRNVRQTTPTLNYGTVKYYGPTMGKTTAAKSNPNLVDFDDYVRPELEQLASELGMTRQQLMMSQDPTVREKARQLMLKSVDGWKKNASNDGKTLVISKSDILQDPIFDNQPLVLQRDEFLKRNAARGETDVQNSLDWYASTRRKGEGKLMEWPDPEGVYISDLEPYVQNPHSRFKLGDVEINDPSLYYRQGTQHMGNDFLKSGIVRAGETNPIKKIVGKIQLSKQAFPNPMFSQGKLWYNENAYSDLLVASPSSKMQLANKYAKPTQFASNAGSRRIPVGVLDNNEVSLFKYTPDYGFRKVRENIPTSYKFFERPSKLTEAERLGIPKGERNQPAKVRTTSQEFSNDYVSAKMTLRKPTYEYEDLVENYFRDDSAGEFNKMLKEYVSYARSKGSPVLTSEISEPIVKGYRNYLHHLDFDAADLSDEELRIILSKHFNDLSNSASGKMKDQLVWHSSPTWFDEFDYRYTGTNMENSGAMGPGNYFSKEATMYGRGKKGEYSNKYSMGNTQPYVITKVSSTPSGKDMQDKGLLPRIIQKYRGRDRFGQKWDPDPEFDIKLKEQINAVPSNDNKMYVLEGTDSGFDKLYQKPFNITGGELMLRRNTGIKSLYPHPSRFVRDEDGFVHLLPVDWNDPRVNFKEGGKINPQQ